MEKPERVIVTHASFKDITDQPFGLLTARYPVRIKGRLHWFCECECGGTKIALAGNLTRNYTRSCGCQSGMLPKGQSSFNRMFYHYQFMAKKMGREFAISRDEFYAMTQELCHYCGQVPAILRQDPKLNGVFIGNGLDRVDNDQGYLPSNCVPCCKACNYLKGRMGADDFIALCKRIANHQATRRRTAA